MHWIESCRFRSQLSKKAVCDHHQQQRRKAVKLYLFFRLCWTFVVFRVRKVQPDPRNTPRRKATISGKGSSEDVRSQRETQASQRSPSPSFPYAVCTPFAAAHLNYPPIRLFLVPSFPSMASDSDSSDEFYDALDDSYTAGGGGPNSSRRRSDKSNLESGAGTSNDSNVTSDRTTALQHHHKESAAPSNRMTLQASTTKGPTAGSSATVTDQPPFKEPKSLRSQRFHELRQSMQNDEDENPGNILTPDSQNSSVEGVYIAPSRSNYPFRVIESDVASIHSISSLGIVGRIMAGGSIDTNALSVGSSSVKQLQAANKQQGNKKATTTTGATGQKTADPDVIPSTKQHLAHSKTADATFAVPAPAAGTAPNRPVAPPRRKKKTRKLSSSSSEQCNMNEGLKLPPADSSSSEVLMVKLPGPAAPSIATTTESTIDVTTTTTTSNTSQNTGLNGVSSAGSTGSDATTTGGDSISGQTLPSPATLESITREIENSFEEAASVASAGGGGSGSLTRITHQPGGQSKCSHISPTGSLKSISTGPSSHVSWTDNAQGLNLYKATKGQYVVKPTDGAFNKAEGPSRDEIARVERIRREFFRNLDSVRGTGAIGSVPGGGIGGAPGTSGMGSIGTVLGPGGGGGGGSHRKNFSFTGTNSLEGGMRHGSLVAKQLQLRERRKSAGDEEQFKQMNMYVRTRTSSGKQLTDMEILEQVPVKNLDTGENFPLSAVEEKLPQCINPLSLHIMRLTSHIPETDEESVGPQPDSDSIQPGYEEELESELGLEGGRLKRRTARLKRFFRSTAKKTVSKAKSIASEVSHARHKEDVADIQDVSNPEQNIKIKASSTNKGPYDFAKLQHVQDLTGEHTVAVWCMKFSSCGRLLATAGQDRVLCIWVLKDAYPFFQTMRTKYNADQKSSPTPSEEALNASLSSSLIAPDEAAILPPPDDASPGPFMPRAFCTYAGHTSDLLDVSWSKNYFILSSSMDKTVRLWHISRRECLCCFQHIDFVTAIAFHPRDDRYFLSGSLDGKLRLWNIPEKKVALWNEVDGQTKLITAANFCANGKFAVVGTYDGRCIFYNTDQLKYHTQIHVRSTRGRNAIGRKISGIEPMPGEDKILVTSNDSRIRLYDLRDLNLSCKYKGYLNSSSQIKASFSQDGKYIISGSENQCIYIWKTRHEYNKLSSVRRDRSDFWEGIKAHNATVTCAIFAPKPEAIIMPDPDETNPANISINQSFAEQSKKACRGYVMVSADFSGCIKVFINKTKPKHSSLPYTAIAD
uniref:WD repeat-containing protein 44 n=1 Tax=Anopheles farauti TaxID=69004 RepID=A0A182Q5M6_9DIPT